MTTLLDTIDSPNDVKKLNKRELHNLAREIREEVISTVSKQGGHLAPNLGVVELSIALHYVFQSPKDQIVWDVGHQSYPHKLLTGRKKQFHTLRQRHGISGYPDINESKHDMFGTSHASTSISAALGMACAKSIKNESGKVIAVIGDGALTGGMSFEALNHSGHLKKDLIVILNDNHMSIAENVGALSHYLAGLATNPEHAPLRKRVKELIKSFPAIGESAAKKVQSMERSLIKLNKQGMYFNALGFKYFGPINGHDMGGLITALRNIRMVQGPILLHVVTQKGRGYDIAVNDKEKYHGVSPFHVESGESVRKSKVMSYTGAFSRALTKLAQKDKRIVGITAAMPKGTGLDAFAESFPDRFYDVGIAEQHAVTFAAGLARNGMKPVCAIYSTFLQRAFDQVIHDVCAQDLDVTFALDRAGLVGEDGKLQHGAYDYAYLSVIPGMSVLAPKDENELGHLLRTAIDHPGPAAIRYPRGAGQGVAVANPYKKLPWGKSELLKSGRDITLFGAGTCGHLALKAAKELNGTINAEAINARFIKPLDEKALLRSVDKTGHILIIEEGAAKGGVGSMVTQVLQEHDSYAKIDCLGIPDTFVGHGPAQQLREEVGLTTDHIVKRALRLVK